MSGIMCISGNDPSGGSGIAADIRASSSIGTHCHPVISSITSQTHEDVMGIESVSSNILRSQIKAALAMDPGAIKIGLLHTTRVMDVVIQSIGESPGIPVVVDPVFASSSTFPLVEDGLIPAFKALMIPISTIITPNIPEAEALTGLNIRTHEDIQEACNLLYAMGASNVLVKGGHMKDEEVIDTLFDGTEFHYFSGRRIPGSFRGTGCAYSTLIACNLARGFKAKFSIAMARNVLQTAMEDIAGNDGNSVHEPENNAKNVEKHHILFLGGPEGGGA